MNAQTPNVVDILYGEFQDIMSNLDQAEISLRLTAEDAFRKNLLLAASSYFEHEIKECVVSMIGRNCRCDVVVEFVRNKAIERQFHTYFQWGSHNANSFFGLFGKGFKDYMDKRVKEDEEYEQAVRAFLELGNDRNRLVHQNFGIFTLEKTSEEIFAYYKKACLFVASLGPSFDDYLQSTF